MNWRHWAPRSSPTNADKPRSLNYLKHARFSVMGFDTPELPGAFTTLIHGMFLGTPSVVTSCLGMNDYVVNNANGLVTPHGDEAGLRHAIEQLWNDPSLVERFTIVGRERAEKLYSLEAAAARFDLLVDQVLGSPS
jgi:glycosyltransferase involved in cell wall biosynthesis